MSDRDATFIPIFDELYSNHDSALYRLVEWGLVHASKQAITDDIAESCAIILSVDIFVREAHIDSLVRKVGFTTQGNTHVFCLLFERR